MRIIAGGRRTGRTTRMLQEWYEVEGAIFVCINHDAAENLKKRAIDLWPTIPPDKLHMIKHVAQAQKWRHNPTYVDDLEMLLPALIPGIVQANVNMASIEAQVEDLIQ